MWKTFLIIFLSFFVWDLFILYIAYFWGARYRWIILSKYSFAAFNQNSKLASISFIIKGNKVRYFFKYYFFFIFYEILNLITLIIDLQILFFVSSYSKKNTFLLVIPFLIIFLLFSIILFLMMKKFSKELKQIGIHSKVEAIANFNKFRTNLKVEKLKKFQIVKNKNISIQNTRFQFQQKHNNRKIKRIIKRKNPDYQLLNAFIKYLQNYGYFLNQINESSFSKQYQIFLEESQDYQSLSQLGEILINNFFAFAAQAEVEFKTNQKVD